MNDIRNDPNLDDAFPRWMATTKLINPDIRNKNTSAVAIIGVRLFNYYHNRIPKKKEISE